MYSQSVNQYYNNSYAPLKHYPQYKQRPSTYTNESSQSKQLICRPFSGNATVSTRDPMYLSHYSVLKIPKGTVEKGTPMVVQVRGSKSGKVVVPKRWRVLRNDEYDKLSNHCNQMQTYCSRRPLAVAVPATMTTQKYIPYDSAYYDNLNAYHNADTQALPKEDQEKQVCSMDYADSDPNPTYETPAENVNEDVVQEDDPRDEHLNFLKDNWTFRGKKISELNAQEKEEFQKALAAFQKKLQNKRKNRQKKD